MRLLMRVEKSIGKTRSITSGKTPPHIETALLPQSFIVVTLNTRRPSGGAHAGARRSGLLRLARIAAIIQPLTAAGAQQASVLAVITASKPSTRAMTPPCC